MSDSARRSSRAGTYPGISVRRRVWCSTCMPKPDARRATARPMRPYPTRPRVAPCTSWPRYWLTPHPDHAPPQRRSRFCLRCQRRHGALEHEEEGDIGGGLVEHAGGIAHRHPQAAGGVDVDVVVSHRHVGDHSAGPPLPPPRLARTIASSIRDTVRRQTRHSDFSTVPARATNSGVGVEAGRERRSRPRWMISCPSSTPGCPPPPRRLPVGEPRALRGRAPRCCRRRWGRFRL